MKHILPILTLALLGAALTASAADYYYDDVYGTSNPTTEIEPVYGEKQGNWAPSWQKDTVTYTDFTISRLTQQGGIFSGSSDNFYLIRVTGDNVKLSLTDYVDNIQDQGDGKGFNQNAIANMGVAQYGYRLLDENGNIIGDTKYIDVPAIDAMTEADVIDSGTVNNHLVNRYKYELGTFKKGTVLELYMKGEDGTEAYSYNSLVDTVQGVEGQKYKDQGGFADGYTVTGASTDKLLHLYYGLTADATRKAMPLAELDLAPDGSNRVYFGIHAQAVGSPLPGGLPVVLVAGLFGLGFWFIRRRKAVAA